jgi:peptidoglycan/xylan/chitin deacetylase (PgdA/CDA1 family)
MPISLIYHDVVAEGRLEDSGFRGHGADSYKLTPRQFERHLDVIEGTGLKGTSHFDTLLKYGSSAVADTLLTFDDGGIGALLAADMLDARALKGCFLITTNYIGQPRFLGPPHLRELRRRGHIIGSHSASHPMRMSACTHNELMTEWATSTSRLSDLLGEAILSASVPSGYYSRKIAIAASACGIRVLFTSEPTTAAKRVNDCEVLGRFSIKSRTTVEEVAALVRGEPVAILKQRVLWNGKKALKKVCGPLWMSLRDRLLKSRI